MRLTFIASGLFLAIAACASPGTPPGGPVDTQAPKILRIAPDSGKTGVKPREVIFEFDEVVAERPSGAASLGALFLISPRNGDTDASWHRSSISVRPQRGWKSNTTYTVNLLPGLSDLRGNTSNVGLTTVFSTGPSLATGRISGTLYNWAESRVIANGLVEARALNDTATVYVTATDSAGDFTLRNIPAAQYRVRGIADDNRNRGIDPREAYDTAIVTLADSAKTDLLAFVHDSVGTRIAGVTVRDSVTLELLFDNPLSVTSPLTVAQIRIRGSDSTDVPIASVAAPLPDTMVTRPVAGNPLTPVTTTTTTSTTTSPAMRKPPRAAPLRSVVIKLSRPLRPKVSYRVRATDVRNLIGVAKTSEKEVTLPVPAVPPPGGTKPPAAGPPTAPQPMPIKK